MLANLIEKYADTLDLEHLPEPPHELSDAQKDAGLNKIDEFSIESAETA